ncbi:MAG: GNAT family protein [Rhizobiaceae bacterium]|nr:GNAT family protein [Rhizobiaceae bacterium]
MSKILINFRPLGPEDISQIADWFADFGDVALFDQSLPVAVGQTFVEESWKSILQHREPPVAIWYMAETQKGEAIGMCGLQKINYIHGDAVIPLFVNKEFRGKGLASAMMLTLLDMAFDTLRLNRVSTMYRDDNVATSTIIKRHGFVEEGRIREGWFAEGKYYDTILVGLLKSEWVKIRPKVAEKFRSSQFEMI